MKRQRRPNPLPVSGVVLLAMLASGCAAKKPSPLESAVINEVKKITVGGRTEANPVADTANNVESGRHLFLERCSFCHGADGQNTGVAIADHMSPPVPVLSSSVVQEYSDGQLKWIIENGLYPSGMPSFKGVLTQEEVWRVVHYIRHLPKKLEGSSMAKVGEIAASSKTEVNPVTDTAENLDAGKRVFLAHCAFCHGTGRGVSSSDRMIDFSLVRQYPEGQLKRIVENGNASGMPSFDDTLTQEEIWKVVHYIKHLSGEQAVENVSAERNSKTHSRSRHFHQGG